MVPVSHHKIQSNPCLDQFWQNFYFILFLSGAIQSMSMFSLVFGISYSFSEVPLPIMRLPVHRVANLPTG